jgi:D-arabinose 1-dehydrogenase-like Zn-dependent alcohol dehydrogenase
MREMLSLAQTKGIKPRIEFIPMRLVSKAIRWLQEDKARYRIVRVNDKAPQ